MDERKIIITEDSIETIETLTVDKIIDKYSHLLSEEQIEELKNYKK